MVTSGRGYPYLPKSEYHSLPPKADLSRLRATIDASELKAHVTSQLAAYKAPRNVVVVDSIARAANGKVDYKRLKGLAADELATR